jgi:hypothetical protein
MKRDAPSMSGLNDIADYLGGGASESEGEDTAARVVLTQARKQHKCKESKLIVVKVEFFQGLCCIYSSRIRTLTPSHQGLPKPSADWLSPCVYDYLPNESRAHAETEEGQRRSFR